MRTCVALFALALTLVSAPLRAEETVPSRVTYITFNIGGGAGSKFGFKQPFDMPRAGAYLKSLKADFVALQEVDQFVGRNRNPKRDTAGELARAAGFPHALFGKAIRLGGGEYGIALLSKVKPSSWETCRLPSRGEQRVFIDARFPMADGKTLAVCATHLGLSTEERTRQVEAILAHYREKPADRLLLAGDLNATLNEPEFKLLDAALTRLSPEPEKYTWLGDNPAFNNSRGGPAIDHVFGRALPGERWVALPATRRLEYKDQAPLSDHMPVLVEAEVTKGPVAP